MKKIMIQKITQNNWNFWTVNLIMRAKKIVNQSSDFPVRRTGSYRHKKALLTGHCSRHTHTFFGIDHDLHFQSLASCGHEHIGLHVQKVDDKGRFKQSGSKVSKRTDALRVGLHSPAAPHAILGFVRVWRCILPLIPKLLPMIRSLLGLWKWSEVWMLNIYDSVAVRSLSGLRQCSAALQSAETTRYVSGRGIL